MYFADRDGLGLLRMAEQGDAYIGILRAFEDGQAAEVGQLHHGCMAFESASHRLCKSGFQEAAGYNVRGVAIRAKETDGFFQEIDVEIGRA